MQNICRKIVREKLQSVVDNPCVRQTAATRMDNRDIFGVWDLQMQMESDSITGCSFPQFSWGRMAEHQSRRWFPSVAATTRQRNVVLEVFCSFSTLAVVHARTQLYQLLCTCNVCVRNPQSSYSDYSRARATSTLGCHCCVHGGCEV